MSTNGNGFFGNLSGGRFLANLYAKDSIQAVFFQKIINSINVVAQNAGVGPIADVPPPSPVNQVNVKTSGEYLNVTLNHAASVSRGINYFVEVAQNDPDFKQPIVHSLGPSRSTPPIQLPTFDDNGNTNKYYVRAFSQYPGSKPSKVTTFGGAFQPASITMGGTTKLTLLPSTGSGTSSTTGQQGASGFGRVLTANKLTGSGAQGGGPSASVPPSGGGGSGPITTPPAGPTTTIFGDTLKDHFYFGSASGLVGELGWSIASAVTAASGGLIGGGALPHIGAASIVVPSAAQNTSGYIQPAHITTESGDNPSFYGGMAPLFDYPGWTLNYTFQLARWPTQQSIASPFPLTKQNIYIGLRSWNDANPNIRPRQFVGLRFDPDTTSPSIGDTTFHFEGVANNNSSSNTLNNTQGNVSDTGIVPTEFVWYTLTIAYPTLGTVNFTLSGSDGSSATASLAVPIYAYTSAGGTTATLSHGIVLVSPDTAAFPGALIPWGIGSLITYTNWHSGSITETFTKPNVYTNDVTVSFLNDTSITVTSPQPSVIISGFPAVYFIAQTGCTSAATPVQNMACYVDLFEYNQIPGVLGT